MANELTRFLAQEESSGGTNQRARTLDAKGTGKYQLSKALYIDIQKAFPEFKDIPYKRAALEDGLDRQVAGLGTRVVQQQLAGIGMAPTPALIATVWQQGIGNFSKAVNKATKTKSKKLAPHLDPLGQRRLNRATTALADPIGGTNG